MSFMGHRIKEINGHYVAKLIPNPNCHYLVSQLIELTLVQDNQKLGFQKKSLSWKKNLSLKKTPEF